MKVYKVSDPNELEKWTLDGWALDKVLGSTHADKVSCSTPIAKPQQNGDYYGTIETHQREEVVQVHEPLFLLVPDGDVRLLRSQHRHDDALERGREVEERGARYQRARYEELLHLRRLPRLPEEPWRQESHGIGDGIPK